MPNMTPIEYYLEQCSKGFISKDEQQLIALKHLQKIHEHLLQEHQSRSGFFAKLRKPHLVQGLYLWGGVGIGKTFLMDCFYHCVPFAEKMRLHFHQFMRMVHQELKQHQGQKDPLEVIAKKIAKKTLLLCFDELFVSDITDAMLLGRLFRALYAQGVCIVSTSNVKPDDLYKNGLQRQQFLPAIAMLKRHSEVIHINTDIDYRLRHLKNAGVFYTPNDEIAESNMQKSFDLLTDNLALNRAPIEICHRHVPVKKSAGDVVWFDFNVICAVPRSQHDYLAYMYFNNSTAIENMKSRYSANP